MPTPVTFDPKDVARRFTKAKGDPYMTTPAAITLQLERFCAMFARDPEYVPVDPIVGEAVDDCINVVLRKVERDGGKAVVGWQLWEWPGMYVEAELHAVWRSPGDDLIDVSPKVNGEAQILFMADPLQQLGERRTDNIRYAYSDHPSVHGFIEWCEHRFELIGPIVKQRIVRGEEAQRIVKANYHIAYHLLEMRAISDRAAVATARARSRIRPARS